VESMSVLSPTVTIAILAGGAATRLDGRDKGLELLGGRPLVASVLEAIERMDVGSPALEAASAVSAETTDGAASAALLQASSIEAAPAIVAPMEAAFTEATSASTIARFALLIVANRHLDLYSRHATTISDHVTGFPGPLAGVASALLACGTPWLLTVPVDCPEPPHDLASRLFAEAAKHGTVGVVAHDGDRRQPLFAIYRRELAESAAAAVLAGQGVWSWQDSIGARELDFSDRRRQFLNFNTPEDFAAHAERVKR
jgi:molybdopterin-guanine dinucleotide biosynthesis protein A